MTLTRHLGLDAILKRVPPITFAKGARIYSGCPDALYLVQSGCVRVVRDDRTHLFFAGPDDVFGENAFVGSRYPMARQTATAVTNVEVMRYERMPDMNDLRFACALVFAIRAEDYARAMDRSWLKVRQRLLLFLREVVAQVGTADIMTPDWMWFPHGVTHKMLSEGIQTSRELATHYINELYRERLMHAAGKSRRQQMAVNLPALESAIKNEVYGVKKAA